MHETKCVFGWYFDPETCRCPNNHCPVCWHGIADRPDKPCARCLDELGVLDQPERWRVALYERDLAERLALAREAES